MGITWGWGRKSTDEEVLSYEALQHSPITIHKVLEKRTRQTTNSSQRFVGTLYKPQPPKYSRASHERL